MKKMLVLVSVLLLLFALTACNTEKAVPLENPSIEAYELYHEFDEYSILKKSDIPEDTIYLMYGLSIGPKGNTCLVGHYHEMNFIIQYGDNYYSVREADLLGVYDCDELQDIGFISDMYDDE
jgi:hypothetical protein